MTSFNKLITSAGVAMLLLGGANFAHATSLTSAQMQAVITMLQSFNVDQKTIVSVQAVLNGAAVSSSASTPCVTLSANLYPDVTDATTNGQVTTLQQFLKLDPDVYPQGLVTGYFGPATLAGVQRWQSRHGVVFSGDPDTTGYGFVGTKTRAAMSCTNPPTTTAPTTPTSQNTPTNTAATTSASTATASPSVSTATTTPQSPASPSSTPTSGGLATPTPSSTNSTSSTTAPAADSTPPSISSILVDAITSSSATVHWSTDELATTQIYYGSTPSYGALTPLVSSLMTTHSALLDGAQVGGFAAGTSYYFKVMSKDGSGNLSTSEGQSFTTLGTIVSGPGNSVLSVTRLFFGQFDNTKYSVSLSDPDGIGDLEVKTAGGSVLWGGSPRNGTPPCPAGPINTGTVTLQPSDFPLQGWTIDCATAGVKYTLQASMPELPN